MPVPAPLVGVLFHRETVNRLSATVKAARPRLSARKTEDRGVSGWDQITPGPLASITERFRFAQPAVWLPHKEDEKEEKWDERDGFVEIAREKRREKILRRAQGSSRRTEGEFDVWEKSREEQLLYMSAFLPIDLYEQ